MPQELLYQERSIAEIGRINPDLWDFGRLPSPLLYRLRFRGFPPCPLLFPLPLSSDSANQRRSAKFRSDLLRVGRTLRFSARSDRPIVIGRFRGSPLGTIIPFPSSEDCDLRNASPQRSRPSLSIWSSFAYLLGLATVSDIFAKGFRTSSKECFGRTFGFRSE